MIEGVNRRRRKRNGNARSNFQQIAAKQRRVIRTAARDEDDEIDLSLFERSSQPLDLRSLFRDCLFERRRLLGNFLKH